MSKSHFDVYDSLDAGIRLVLPMLAPYEQPGPKSWASLSLRIRSAAAALEKAGFHLGDPADAAALSLLAAVVVNRVGGDLEDHQRPVLDLANSVDMRLGDTLSEATGRRWEDIGEYHKRTLTGLLGEVARASGSIKQW
jgi:hypothetical protein